MTNSCQLTWRSSRNENWLGRNGFPSATRPRRRHTSKRRHKRSQHTRTTGPRSPCRFFSGTAGRGSSCWLIYLCCSGSKTSGGSQKITCFLFLFSRARATSDDVEVTYGYAWVVALGFVLFSPFSDRYIFLHHFFVIREVRVGEWQVPIKRLVIYPSRIFVHCQYRSMEVFHILQESLKYSIHQFYK